MNTLSGLPPEISQDQLQKRVIRSLSASQLLSGIGNGASLAVGSLLAVQISGSEAFAGAATLAISVAGALSALPLASLALQRGRRRALTTGYFLAALGALGMMFVPPTQSFPLLLVSAFLLGVGNAANLQARFAATDLAAPQHRGRDLGLVVWAITIGAVAGPNLIAPGAAIGRFLGLPDMSGPFVISLVGMIAAILVLNLGLRPDPLKFAQRLKQEQTDGVSSTEVLPRRSSLVEGVSALRALPQARLGVGVVVFAHLTMVGIMSMTPVHVQHLSAQHSGGSALAPAAMDTLVVIGFIISLHIAGMFALSPLFGMLADRWGRQRSMVLAQAVFAASALCVILGKNSQLAVTVSLVLLGLAWSIATVSGSAYVSESVTEESRVPVQGMSDTLMGVAGAAGSGLAGLVLATWGFEGLAWIGLAIAGAVAVWILSNRSRAT
ncbi:MFS family permease [Neomicrococcus aestuarii]|uniref:MFS family permease n=1 Tax=Neomicrococcus aestuarii TaxID=556325 RepID=A0A7W8WZG6_9MICC|nr:MFS transporter [Neomicrococcus aestuarii]MBB5511803.1 MFS family permease [Neomicrococcus aestuarii]